MWCFIFLKDLWRFHLDAAWSHGISQKMSNNLPGTRAHGPLTQPIGARGPRVYCIACMFVKFHPLTLDSMRNTRDVFIICLDPCVYIMFSPEAPGFHWLCHVGFWEMTETLRGCTTYWAPQPTSEEEFSPIGATCSALPDNGLGLGHTMSQRGVGWCTTHLGVTFNVPTPMSSR